MKISHGYEYTGGVKLVYDTLILMVSIIYQMAPRGMSKMVQEENACHLTECRKNNKLYAEIFRGKCGKCVDYAETTLNYVQI